MEKPWPSNHRRTWLPAALLLPLFAAQAQARTADREQQATEAGGGGKKDAAKKLPADGAGEAVKVTLIDKAELRAEPSEIGKVLRKLKKRDKFDFVERSPDGKWAKLRKGKLEGFTQVELLEGLPASGPAGSFEPTVDSKPVAAAKTVTAAKPTAAAVTPVAATSPLVSPPPPLVANTAAGDVCPNVDGAQEFVPVGMVKDGKSGLCVVEQTPGAKGEPSADSTSEPSKPLGDGLHGFMLSIGGGLSLLSSSSSATTSSGIQPELFNYSVSNLTALGLQARVGYTFAYKWLRAGVDGGYRFGGATSIVVKLPDRSSLPLPAASGGTVTVPLQTARQDLNTTAHDADAAASFGGYFKLPKQLELAIKLRAGLQFLSLLPEFNSFAALPQEVYYGPMVGGVVEFQSRYVVGFGVRLDGGYIPYAVRQENTGLRDGTQDSSRGYYVGGAAAVRIVRGFDVELTYRLLSTSTDYQMGSNPERLRYDRDPGVQRLYAAGETVGTGSRSTSMQSLNLNLVFFRR